MADKKTEKSAGTKAEIRLRAHYDKVVKDALVKQFGYKNPMQIPCLEKIVINMGVGDATDDRKALEGAMADLGLITGQKPVPTYAKRSEAGFKIREGQAIGCKVTLRKAQMYEFLDRLITIAMPMIKDFRGVSGKSFDGRGNYAMGLKEHIVFPEIDYDKVDKIRGMDIIMVTSAETDDEARALLKGFNMPFREQQSS